MRSIFNDAALQAEFDQNGYVIVPFLDNAEVEYLKKAYFDTLPQRGGIAKGEGSGINISTPITYDFTFIDRSSAYKSLVFDLITKCFAPLAGKYLDKYSPIIANFIRKDHDGGEVPLHQNWAFVDEQKYTSVSIWCPLIDSNEANGTLQIVKQSHKRFGKIRGPMVPWELNNIKNDIINDFLTPMNVKAGQAVILDDSIVHYSAINKTQDLRLAIQLILIPAETHSIHHHFNTSIPNNPTIDVLKVDKDFYMSFTPWKNPENVPKIARIPFKPHLVGIDEFKTRLKGRRFDEEQTNNSLWQKIWAIFSDK